MLLKKVGEQFAFVMNEKETEVIKNIIDKSDAELKDLKEIIENDKMIENKLSNGMVQNMLANKLAEKVNNNKKEE